MFVTSLIALFTIYLLPVGRRLFALRGILALATSKGLTRVMRVAEAAIAHDTRTLALVLRRRGASRALHGPEVQELDAAVDGAVSGIDKQLESVMQTYGEKSRRGKAAATLRKAAFPDGVRPIIKQPFVQQHETVTGILAQLGTAELAPLIAAIAGLSDMIDHLAQLNRRYGDALLAGKESVPSPQEVRAAQDRGQELFREVVAVIVAEYALAEDKSGRDALLQPVYEQQEAMRLSRRRRRSGSDIDPDTGDELPDTDDPDGDFPGADSDAPDVTTA